MDTIFALASAEGRAGVAVIRISGKDIGKVCDALGFRLPKPRYASLQKIKDQSGEILDEALVLYFEEGASFTGEDVLELHVHGGRSIVSAVFGILADVPNCRFAEPGEFTRRAVEAGRLDLAKAEGLIDLIDAQTDAQRKQAMNLFQGGLSSAIAKLRADLLEARGLLEASIDFADEEVPEDVTEPVRIRLASVESSLEKALLDARRANSQREGFSVAIVGEPNVGKSTLLNYIAGREVAIASEIAGTTRDVIEVKVELEGQLFVFMDTAGIRETDDVVEKLGVEKARRKAAEADMRIFLSNADGAEFENFMNDRDFVAVGKDDKGRFENGISGTTGIGVEGLLRRVVEVRNRLGGGAGLGNDRHASAMRSALTSIQIAVEDLAGIDGFDVASEHVREASVYLAKITGDIGTEDVLGEVFSRFCVGK